jgi:hypothetical protein
MPAKRKAPESTSEDSVSEYDVSFASDGRPSDGDVGTSDVGEVRREQCDRWNRYDDATEVPILWHYDEDVLLADVGGSTTVSVQMFRELTPVVPTQATVRFPTRPGIRPTVHSNARAVDDWLGVVARGAGARVPPGATPRCEYEAAAVAVTFALEHPTRVCHSCGAVLASTGPLMAACSSELDTVRFRLCQFRFLDYGRSFALDDLIAARAPVELQLVLTAAFESATSSRLITAFEPFPSSMLQSATAPYNGGFIENVELDVGDVREHKPLGMMSRIASYFNSALHALEGGALSERAIRDATARGDEAVHMLSHALLTLRSRLIPMRTGDDMTWFRVEPRISSSLARRLRSEPTTFLFHGTGLDKVHTILRTGLLNFSNTAGMIAGAVHGDGVYFTSCVDYASTHAKSDGYIFICEVVLSSVNRHGRGTIFTVQTPHTAVVIRALVPSKCTRVANTIVAGLDSRFEPWEAHVENATQRHATRLSTTLSTARASAAASSVHVPLSNTAVRHLQKELRFLTTTMPLGVHVVPNETLSTLKVHISDVALLQQPVQHMTGYDVMDSALNRLPNGLGFEVVPTPDYPHSPPFVRVMYPIFKSMTGHVTSGGSICSWNMSPQGWVEFISGIQSPRAYLYNALLMIIGNMVHGNASTELSSGGTPMAYSAAAARESFDRAMRAHSVEWGRTD